MIRCPDPNCFAELEEVDRLSSYGQVGYGDDEEYFKPIIFRWCLKCGNIWHQFEWWTEENPNYFS